MTLLDSLRVWFYGPSAATYISPPLERRGVYPYAGSLDVGPLLRAGTLVHGPGATEALRDAFGRTDADNSAVLACLAAIVTAYTEARLRIYRPDSKSNEVMVDRHPLGDLLARPNPHLTLRTLLGYAQWCKHTHGNAYWHKVRAGNAETGKVIELWPISPDRIAPLTQKGSGDFISYYRYWYGTGGTQYEDLAPENVVHFRMGLDDEDHRLGLGPLRRLTREIATDREATAFSDRLLKNNAVPGTVVIPPKEASVSQEQADVIKTRLQAAFGGENAGMVGVLSGGADMKQFGFDPKSLDLTALHRLPEERISAVLRVPAIIAGLGAGLDRATYANFKEAREQFIENTILPLYTEDAETITHQLLPDFSSRADEYVRFDISDMRALQADEDAKYKRLDLGVQGGWITVNEARSDIGLAPLPGGDVPVVKPPGPVPALRAGRLEQRAVDLSNFPELLAQARAAAERELTVDMTSYLASQRKRVRARVEAS